MRMEMTMFKLPVLALAAVAFAHAAIAQSSSALADELARGKYLVTCGGCADCHTPKVMTPKGPGPNATRMVAGHFAMAPLPKIPPGVLGPPPKYWGAMTNSDLTARAGPWG